MARDGVAGDNWVVGNVASLWEHFVSLISIKEEKEITRKEEERTNNTSVQEN